MLNYHLHLHHSSYTLIPENKTPPQEWAILQMIRPGHPNYPNNNVPNTTKSLPLPIITRFISTIFTDAVVAECLIQINPDLTKEESDKKLIEAVAATQNIQLD